MWIYESVTKLEEKFYTNKQLVEITLFKKVYFRCFDSCGFGVRWAGVLGTNPFGSCTCVCPGQRSHRGRRTRRRRRPGRTDRAFAAGVTHLFGLSCVASMWRAVFILSQTQTILFRSEIWFFICYITAHVHILFLRCIIIGLPSTTGIQPSGHQF